MCIEDIRLGRESYTGESIATVGTSVVELIPASPKRVAIVISPPAAGSITVSTNPNVTNNNGIIVSAGNPPFTMDIRAHGAIVRKRLYAIASTTGNAIGVWSTHLDAE